MHTDSNRSDYPTIQDLWKHSELLQVNHNLSKVRHILCVHKAKQVMLAISVAKFKKAWAYQYILSQCRDSWHMNSKNHFGSLWNHRKFLGDIFNLRNTSNLHVDSSICFKLINRQKILCPNFFKVRSDIFYKQQIILCSAIAFVTFGMLTRWIWS
jgi:hypothetical protein